MMIRTTLLTAAVMLAPLAAIAQPAPPTGPAQPLEYAVKFVCGSASGENGRYPRMADGVYFTAVNVHNPGRAVRISHKVALAEVGRPGRMTEIRTDLTLNYDQAIDFDCEWISRRLGDAPPRSAPPFFTGFLVLQVRTPIDVVAVYSAQAREGVTTMHTERVPVRRVQ